MFCSGVFVDDWFGVVVVDWLGVVGTGVGVGVGVVAPPPFSVGVVVGLWVVPLPVLLLHAAKPKLFLKWLNCLKPSIYFFSFKFPLFSLWHSLPSKRFHYKTLWERFQY